MSTVRAEKIIRAVFNNLGISIVELCRILRDPLNTPDVVVSDESLACLNESLSLNRGVIFVTGHIGNWELMAIELARLGIAVSTVAKKSYDKRFTRLIKKKRAMLGVNAIYRNEPGATASMLRALKKGGLLGFLIDQDTNVSSVFVNFFNKPASTPSGPAAFAVKTGTPVVAGTIHRVAGGYHIVKIEKVALPDDETEATRLLTAVLEQRIRRHPSQWVWFHNRWRRRPEKIDSAGDIYER
jgi:KDO2-lipid IV(A) lauroyltransferase